MKLVLTGKELVELGNIALKAHHLTGAVMQEIGQKLDQETLLMTDKELLDEAVREAIADIESIGGVVQRGIDDNYIIILPESFTVDFYREFGEVMTVVSPLVLKAAKFFNKHKETLKKFVGYMKAAAGVFGPILETKELVKDFEDLDDESDLVVAKIREVSAKYKKQEIEWEIESVTTQVCAE